ncbi:Aminodeoxychorismate lyase [Alloactinosynnema sp. L-07]|uniref:aminotransferase class IV n=1 Tax=Alloactinosynnema sp. L-07 TaxID=1653480 RepID=UPI00065EF8D2|nr:aminotransferase class IV [Alloactinosynnema sp. L-07]CRK58786.1 Aminodeoxychorismate lyase [Alloactinosynnema sp. L-07]
MSARDDHQRAGYGHYTAMRVEQGRVRGLARHLERLDRDAWVVFGAGIAEDVVRAEIRRAVDGHAEPVYAKATVFAPDFDRRTPEADVEPQVEVTVGALPGDDGPPLRVRTAAYQRDLPTIKHVGVFGPTYHRRLARKAGFDDVLFVNPDNEVCEGATWNICFLDGDTVVFPSAPALPGIAMGLIQSGLTRAGLHYEVRPVFAADLSDFGAAFATNALRPVRPIGAIDDVEFKVDADAVARLRRCHDSTPEERV